MKNLMGKTTLAIMVTALLTSCGGGGTSDSLPADGELTTSLEEGANDAAVIVDDAVTAAGDALEDSTETIANAAEGGWNDLQDNWQDSIGDIKDRWAELSEEDLLMVDGDRDQLVSLVQEKYGLDRESAELEVNDWASTL